MFDFDENYVGSTYALRTDKTYVRHLELYDRHSMKKEANIETSQFMINMNLVINLENQICQLQYTETDHFVAGDTIVFDITAKDELERLNAVLKNKNLPEWDLLIGFFDEEDEGSDDSNS